MVVFGQKWLSSDKVVVFGYKNQQISLTASACIRGKLVLFGQKWLYSGKVVVFGQDGSICAKVVVFVQKWYHLGKRGFIRAKMVVFGQSDCIRAKWLY